MRAGRALAAPLIALTLLAGRAPALAGPADDWTEVAEALAADPDAPPAMRVQAVSMVSRAMSRAGEAGGEPAAAAAAYLLLRSLYPDRAGELDRRFSRTAAALHDEAAVGRALRAGRDAALEALKATAWPARLDEPQRQPRATRALSVPVPGHDGPRPLRTSAPKPRPWWRWESL